MRSLLLALALLPLSLAARDNLLIVGGGPQPKESQVSIERNIIWIGRLTRDAFASRHLLFTAGPDRVKDVVERQADNPKLQDFLPLSRIFGKRHDALSVFRTNRLPRIDAPATSSSVEQNLSSALSDLKPGDSLWFIYNGHGGMQSAAFPSKNTFRLWNNTTLNAQQFASLLQSRPDGISVRSFMPQCFSGGFATSIALTPEKPSASAIDPLQCGFYSVPSNQESEGCTISVDSGEYRDYSTYFFAALSGKRRDGSPVTVETSDNGRPTLLDAHRWAYINSASTDIPFSSSEYFLELWQPWYLRWQSVVTPDENNPYFRTALTLAKKVGIDDTQFHRLARISDERYLELQREINATRQQLDKTSIAEKTRRKRLLNDFLQHYPEAQFPYNSAWNTLIQKQGNEILDWIRQHPDYAELARLQDGLDRLEQQLLEQERAATPYLRIKRMLKLTTIHQQFQRHSTQAEKDTYLALLDCESWIPPLHIENSEKP